MRAYTVTFEQLTPEMTRRPVTEEDIEDHLMTAKVNSPPLDILIRTSGVKRLSDYLLWQVGPVGSTIQSPHALTRSGSALKTLRFTSLIHSGQIWDSSIFFQLYWITSVKFGLNRCFIEYLLIGQRLFLKHVHAIHKWFGGLNYVMREGQRLVHLCV